MSEARAVTNFAGNAVATILIGTWTKEFDRAQAARVLSGDYPFDEARMIDDDPPRGESAPTSDDTGHGRTSPEPTAVPALASSSSGYAG